MQTGVETHISRQEAIESSLFRERTGDCRLLAVEGKVFGLDRKRESHKAVLGRSSGWNRAKL